MAWRAFGAMRTHGAGTLRTEHVDDAVTLGAPVVMVPTPGREGEDRLEARRRWIAGLQEVAPRSHTARREVEAPSADESELRDLLAGDSPRLDLALHLGEGGLEPLPQAETDEHLDQDQRHEAGQDTEEPAGTVAHVAVGQGGAVLEPGQVGGPVQSGTGEGTLAEEYRSERSLGMAEVEGDGLAGRIELIGACQQADCLLVPSLTVDRDREHVEHAGIRWPQLGHAP